MSTANAVKHWNNILSSYAKQEKYVARNHVHQTIITETEQQNADFNKQ